VDQCDQIHQQKPCGSDARGFLLSRDMPLNPKLLLCAAQLAISLPAAAGGSGDRWGDSHVKLHLIGVGAVSAAVTAVTDDRAIGFAAGLAVGIAREEWKRRNGYAHYSPSRNTAHILGAALGAQLGHCLVAGDGISCALSF
jgi:hypothetical protein